MNRALYYATRFGGGGPMDEAYTPDAVISQIDESEFVEEAAERALQGGWFQEVNVGGDGHCFFYAVIRCIADKANRKIGEARLLDSAVTLIGPDVVSKFRDSTYKGIPSDTSAIRREVLREMVNFNDTEKCIDGALLRQEASNTKKGATGPAFVDIGCAYAHALSRVLNMGVAIEFQELGRKWMFVQPGDTYKSEDDRIDAHLSANWDAIQAKKMHTVPERATRSKARCKDAIYMRLYQSHFTSYLYVRDIALRVDEKVARKLQQQYSEQDREEALNLEVARKLDARR